MTPYFRTFKTSVVFKMKVLKEATKMKGIESMGNFEELTKRNNRYGKNAVAALIAGTMIASSVTSPIAAFAQSQELDSNNSLEQSADGVGENPTDQSDDNTSTDDSTTSANPTTPQTTPTTPQTTPDSEASSEDVVTPNTPEDNVGNEDITTPPATNPGGDTTIDGEDSSLDQDNGTSPDGSEGVENGEGDTTVTPDGETEDGNTNEQDNTDKNHGGVTENNQNENDTTFDESVDTITPQDNKSETAPAPVTPAPAPSADSANKISNSASALSPSYNYDANQTYVSSHKYTEDMTTSSFVAAIAENARQIGQERDLYASVMIAQAILESASGTSDLSEAPNNNLFGIKGVWYDEDGVGHKATFKTMEDDGSGNLYEISSDFRAYDTIADSMEDYADLLHDTENGMGEYYKGTWKSNTESYKDACYALQGTYATDTSYASKLIGLIETYELDRFDEKLDYEIVGQKYDPESEEANEDGYRDLTMKDYANIQAIATSQLGTPYVWGGETPEDGFDCSGLVNYVYKEALGVDITRTTYTQQYQGEEIPLTDEDLRMGDLLFFVDNGDVHHVGMYLGDGYYIHAPKPGDEVRITAMEDYTPDFAKRVVDFKDIEETLAAE